MSGEDYDSFNRAIQEARDRKYKRSLKLLGELSKHPNITSIIEYEHACFKIESKGMTFNYFPVKNRIYFFNRKNWIDEGTEFLRNYYKLKLIK